MQGSTAGEANTACRTDVSLRSAAGGRYRQFHQYGVDVFGANDPTVTRSYCLPLSFFSLWV